MDRRVCRAKDIKTGEWVYGYYIRSDGKINHGRSFILSKVTGIHRYNGAADIHGFIEVDLDTVCQCTGWHDSNKTPIFEKDIVEFVGPSTHRDLIWWCNEMSMMTAIPLEGIEFNGYDFWNGKCPKVNYSSFCLMMQDPYGDFREIKVVGNIVDNPELLEVQNEASI